MSNERQSTVLVINDVPAIIRLLELELQIGYGFVTAGCEVGDAAFEAIDRLQPDVIILELLLPGMNGLDMLADLKKRFEIPVLILTTSDSDADRVQAFELGADDFIRKPFEPAELGKRVAALAGREPARRRFVRFGDCEIDLTRQIARRGPTVLSLSTNEWAVLLALGTQPRVVMSANELAHRIGGAYSVAHVGEMQFIIERVRKSLEADPARPSVVLGDPDTGYMLDTDVLTEG
jgi:DNA-binding response OmpR family regulator